MSPGAGFFARRWRGEVDPGLLLWRDMVGVGSFINLLASFMALFLVAQGVATWIAVALHFAPLPYNLFLFLSLWRLARRTALQSLVALAWVLVMMVV